MNSVLRQFLKSVCVEHPAARVQTAQFFHEFGKSLPVADRPAWTRDRVVAELVQAGFTLGRDQKVSWIAGLALRGQWTARAGNLTFVRA
ncbi:MAG TPA: hypothetical protein VHY91_14565 [Pirellulales bacterium]|nr:hypothetical protein [Pirellulales bacterium]